MTTPADAEATRREFSNLLAQLEPRFSDPSTTKFKPVADFLADALGLAHDKIYVATVSKPGNLDVRFRQPGVLTKRPVLGVGILTNPEHLEPCIRAGHKLVGPGHPLPALALATKSGEQWHIVTILDPRGSVASRLSQIFPKMTVDSTMQSSASVTRSPAGAITAVPMMLDDRILRMVRLAISTAPAVMLVGPPGTGKTTILREMIGQIKANPSAYGFSKGYEAKWVTPEESWTTRELVGGETVDDRGRLRFRPGHVLEAIQNNEWLVLDEANRADMDKIFGGLLTWLAGQEVELGRASSDVRAARVMLAWGEDEDCSAGDVDRLARDDPGKEPIVFLAGREWRLLGSYNAFDAQRVFRFGQALGRRFVRVPIPPMSVEQFRELLTAQMATEAELPHGVLDAIVGLYEVHQRTPGAQLGPALFLWIPQYVAAGLQLAGAEQSDVMWSLLVAEAYLASAGVWLAKLEDAQRNAVGQAIAGSVLPASEWEWLQNLLPALG